MESVLGDAMAAGLLGALLQQAAAAAAVAKPRIALLEQTSPRGQHTSHNCVCPLTFISHALWHTYLHTAKKKKHCENQERR